MRSSLFWFFFLTAIACDAQPEKYTAFTVTDGLPSNYVYRCIEDNKGFLWVATDAGIARFDGKHFQVFTTRDGLPDNEVLAVVKENNGRIWVNCFKQRPAYFDEIKNRFINARQDSSLAKITEGTAVMYFFPLQNGGMMFSNEVGSFIYKDGKLITYRGVFFIKDNGDGSHLELKPRTLSRVTKKWASIIYRFTGTTCSDSAVIRTDTAGNRYLSGLNDGKYYFFETNTGKCFIYSNFTSHPVRYRVDTVSVPEPFNNFEFTQDCFYLIGISGKVYLFNKQSLRLEAIVAGNYLANSIYKDQKGSLWVSTIDKGLLVYHKKVLGAVKIPEGYNKTDFLSIAGKKNGTLLAGNFYGDVLEFSPHKVTLRTMPKEGLIARVRKIIVSQGQVLTFSESGAYANYRKRLTFAAKTAFAYNDSIIIVGQSTNLARINTVTGQFSLLKRQRRITAVTVTPDSTIYYGSTTGLYKFGALKKPGTQQVEDVPILEERVTALCVTGDGLVWAATSGSGVAVVKDNKVALRISAAGGLINNATRSITTGRPGQVWLGTAGGISVINYKPSRGQLQYSIQNLSVNDGLVNNVVNDMFYQNDTVYAATGNGISKIPAGISIPKFNIPVQLIRMSVNQHDTIISTRYRLAADQQNLQMQFAGIELSGHFKNFQYTLDKNRNWINLDESTLTVELGSGNHAVQVRAVDVNGNFSHETLTIRFDIAIPYWKTVWFWLIVAFILQMALIYWLNRRIKSRKEANLARQITGVQIASLEQQAFTSLMNPHFIFNALNSIQHYINLQDRQNANRYLSDFASLIRKNFEAAQQSFVPLEQEVENIKIYLRLEQMRFNDRFSYALTIDEKLDTDDWMIPTMVLQPLLENALLHGIMPSSVDGKVTIAFRELEGNLRITITDNGIGLANSLALKTNGGHKSSGMGLIKKRITALSRFGASAMTISMSPESDSVKNPGNKITLVIPQGLHQAWFRAQQS